MRELPEPLRLVGFDLRPEAPEGLDVYHRLDLGDEAALLEAARAETPDRVIHLAGLLPPAADADLWRVNVAGTLSLLRALAGTKKAALRFVTVGSAAEYTNFSARRIREDHSAGGNSPYGRTKWAQSTLALAFGAEAGIKVMVARTFNLIGPGTPQSLVPGALCAQFSNGQQEIKVGNLRPERDFIDIRDAVAAYWAICEKGIPGGIYNVCTGKTASIRALVDLFRQCADGPRRIQSEAARSRKNDFSRVCGDNTRLLKLGCRPKISLKQSVRDMLEHAHS
ncbi:MAG TPA: GDP-mannose 4,6-dehydratase [Verrucomicrobiae bacterium]|nr:GDP-mannose 4,6-dehydratase [Verrucomicrobiae bacterium]